MKRLYNHYFPTPSYLAMNSCAIDISDKSIKYGELVATSSGLRLHKNGREKIPAGVVVSGKIENEGELIRAFERIKSRENIHFIRVSLPEEQMYLFTLTIPKTKDENLCDTILLQIEEYIPLKAADSVFDYDIISEDGQNLFIEVVAMASTTMESYLSVFDKVGLVPLCFEIEAQAIARAVVPDDEKGAVMIVDFGDTRTGVSISKNGRVFLTTTLSIGGRDLTSMIAKNFSLSFEEAEKMKHKYGLNQGSKAQNIFPAILNGISVLRDEVSKQCVYWETHNVNNPKNEKISRIILCGGDANLAGLSDYLELSMKIKIENANVWTNIINTENSVPNMPFEESLGYATVLGLALGGYNYKSQPVINVLPEEEKKLLLRERRLRFSIILLNLIALTGVISTLLLFPSYFLSQQEEKLVESKLEAFNAENPNLSNENIDQITNDINSKLRLLNSKTPTYKVSDDVLDNILSSRIAGITFSQIIFNKKEIKTASSSEDGAPSEVKTEYVSVLEVHGVASNRDTLRNFKTILDNNPSFASVNLPVSDFLEKSNLIFTISITLK